MAKQKLTARSTAWLEMLSGVEGVIDKALAEVAEHEARFATAARDEPNYTELARFSERWQGLWLHTGQAEKELDRAEAALLDAEKDLRAQLDEAVACRQKLAQWLARAVG